MEPPHRDDGSGGREEKPRQLGAFSKIGRGQRGCSMLWTCQLTARFNTPGIGGAALQRAALQLAGLQ